VLASHSPRRSRRFSLALGVALILLMAGIAAQVAGARSVARVSMQRGVDGPLAAAANSQQFSDTTGDGPLDISSVGVANDDQPNIHFDVNLATAIQASTDEITVYIDTDANPSTGGASGGGDYAIDLDFPSNTVGLYKWNGSTFVLASPQPASLAATYGTNHVGIDIKQLDLAGTAAFNFWVGAFRGETEDRAPDTSVWRYDVIIGPAQNPPPPPPQRLKGKRFIATPKPPRAGESFVVEFDVVDADTGKAVYGGVTCKSKLSGKAFAGTDFTRRGNAFCVWNLPASAVGKVLAGSIEVSGDNGASLTRSFRYTVVSPPLRVNVKGFALSPAHPREGVTFYVAARIEILERGGPTRDFDHSGKAICQASIGGRPQAAFTSHWYGKGWLCGWKIPAGTRGQTLTGTIKVTWHGLTASKAFRYAIG